MTGGPKTTLWDFDHHTLAKHKILKRYIEAWAPILTQRSNGRIVYVDGFAGPGEDSKKQFPGSPLIAIDSVANHRLRANFNSEIVLWFIEERKDRANYLESLIKSKYPNLPKSITYEVDNREFNNALAELLDQLDKEGQRLAPTFCFVDPFGWEDLNIELLARFMKQEKAELFITFMAGFIQRFIGEDLHIPSLLKLFSEEQLNEAKTKGPEEKGEFLLKAFLVNLLEKIRLANNGKDIYHVSFETRNSYNNLEYYLIYLTSHERGMEVMKEAMYSVSHTGEFRFSDFDFDPNIPSLVNYGVGTNWEENAAADLYSFVKSMGLLNSALKVEQVKHLVTLYTKYIFRKEILKKLEDSGKIVVTGQRFRPRTYPEDKVAIKFI
ncbi:MAG: three-Cys-motif partner protein TcmP [Thermoproteota archaeon]